MSAANGILAAAQDAGGANALAPVLLELTKRGERLSVVAAGHAPSVLEKAGLAFERLAVEEAPRVVPELLDADPPALVLLGNSRGPSLEDVFVAEARARGVPTLGVLDSWLLYDQKFSGPRGPWTFLPDALIVMDDHAKREMTELGAPGERLLALGQPQLDHLAGLAGPLPEERRASARARLGARDGERLVLLLSQDMKRFYASAGGAGKILGYDEFVVLEQLERSLDRVSAKREPVRLAIKLHPREDEDKFRASKAVVVKRADPYEMMRASDLVVGMDTILLVEGGLLGLPTLSLQPGRVGKDSLITNRLGLGRCCYDPERLPEMLESLIFDEDERRAAVASMKRFPVSPGAAVRAADEAVRRAGRTS